MLAFLHKMKCAIDCFKNTLFRAYVRLRELFGWGYWAYYPATGRLIWTRKECQIYGEPCEGALKVGTYEMFESALLNEKFRSFSEHVVKMSMQSGKEFRQQFVVRNKQTEEIMFVESEGKWVFNRDGSPLCLHGFNRRIDPHDFSQKLDQLNMRRILSEWIREGAIPREFIEAHGPSRK